VSGGFGPHNSFPFRIEYPPDGSQAGMRLTARSQALCISVCVPVLWQESKTYNGSYGSRVLDAAGPGSRPEYTHLRMPFFRIFSLLGGLCQISRRQWQEHVTKRPEIDAGMREKGNEHENSSSWLRS
jgi:hypothetical protein